MATVDVSAVVMLLSSGLFAGGAVCIAWGRMPVWRGMPMNEFVADFAATIRAADRIQPALLVVALASAVRFAVGVNGPSGRLATAGVGTLAIVLATSVGIAVPLQRRIIRSAEADGAALPDMRSRWLRGHLGRACLSTMAFGFLALAAAR